MNSCQLSVGSLVPFSEDSLECPSKVLALPVFVSYIHLFTCLWCVLPMRIFKKHELACYIALCQCKYDTCEVLLENWMSAQVSSQ